jgi:hypothetical protein
MTGQFAPETPPPEGWFAPLFQQFARPLNLLGFLLLWPD